MRALVAAVLLVSLAAVPASARAWVALGDPSLGQTSAGQTSSRDPAAVRTSGTGFVQRAGTGLTLDGRPYRFTGFNIYNANSRDNCWYSLGYADGALAADLDAVGTGQEAFRAWFFQDLATTAGRRDWTSFDQTLAAARARGIKVIATLADQWGNCDSGTGQPAAYKTESWYAAGYRTVVSTGSLRPYRSWVSEIVKHYRNDTTVLAWQLMNEAEIKPSLDAGCSSNAASILRSWAADVAGLVRSTDPNHLVSVGTIGSGQCGSSWTDYQSLHAIAAVDLCEVHDYAAGTMPGDQWNGLALRLDQCAALGKPLFVGETGIENMSLVERALAFDQKFAAQFGAGVAGELVWDLRDNAHGGSSTVGFEASPGDPLVSLFSRY